MGNTGVVEEISLDALIPAEVRLVMDLLVLV